MRTRDQSCVLVSFGYAAPRRFKMGNHIYECMFAPRFAIIDMVGNSIRSAQFFVDACGKIRDYLNRVTVRVFAYDVNSFDQCIGYPYTGEVHLPHIIDPTEATEWNTLSGKITLERFINKIVDIEGPTEHMAEFIGLE